MSQMIHPKQRRILQTLLLFNAATAVAGGIALAMGVMSPPTEWLQRTPFDSYLLPGIILAVVVGGSAALGWLSQWHRQQLLSEAMAFLSGNIMVAWIIGELAYIRTFSWLQVLYVLTGLAVMTLSLAQRHDILVRYEHKSWIRYN